MKTYYTLFVFFISINLCYSQNPLYDIDVSSNLTSSVIPIDPGKYKFRITNIDPNLNYQIKIEKEDLSIEVLENSNALRAAELIIKDIGEFEIENNQQLTINIKVYKIVTDTSGNNSLVEQKSYTYIYKTKKRGEWRTTFGFNFIYKINQDTYFSKANGDNTFIITENTNRDKFDYHPTLMFTWLSSKYLDKKNKNWHFGLSGGLGYDLKTSLSVFTGASFIYNENITFTTGLAFHNQKRLNSNLSEGDIINENLTFNQLHTDFIRVNPFVSISFRLDKNPFK